MNPEETNISEDELAKVFFFPADTSLLDFFKGLLENENPEVRDFAAKVVEKIERK